MFLIDRFCFGDGSPSDPETRLRCGTRAGFLGIAANILLFFSKVGAGLLTHSVAMIADGVNNLSDAAASVVTLFGFRLAGQAADADHPFGHGRMEYISGLVVSIAILFMGIELVRSSVDALLHPVQMDTSPIALLILVLAIVVKLGLFWFHRTYGRKIDSAAMLATASDSLSDCAATAVVLVSSLVGQYIAVPVDGIAGLLVAGVVFKAGLEAMKSTLDPLLGRPMNPNLAADINQLVSSHEPILGIHDIIYHDYGPGRAMMSFHAEVSADGDILALHDLIDHIERELKAKHHIDTVIHMDPVVNDERTIQLRRQVSDLANAIDDRISIHDFRITPGPMHTNLIFDVLVPYEFRLSDAQVCSELSNGIKALSERYYPVIQVDHSYVDDTSRT